MRLSPLSIAFRAFELLVGLGTLAVFAVFVAGATLEGRLRVAVVALGVLLALAISVGYAVAYHRRFEYEPTADTFDVSWGVFTRRDREVPYHRIQNVSIARNLVQRLVGIAEVRVETAGADETEIHLRYVSEAEARRLQETITERKRSETAERSSVEPEATSPERGERLFTITGTELALLGLVSFDIRTAVFVLFAATVLDPQTLTEVLVAVPVVALAPAAVVVLYLAMAAVSGVVAVTNYYGFRLDRLGEELRYERGLLRRFGGSIPLEKIQSLTVDENVLARQVGYASLVIETAGFSPGETSGSQTAVPLARTDRVVDLARTVEAFEAPAFARPPKRARERYVVRYSLVVLAATAVAYAIDALGLYPVDAWYWLLAAIVPVPLAAHLKWRNLGYALQDDHVITRAGFWNRRTYVVPYHRVQTVFQRQTIFQRRRHLASVRIDTAGARALVGQDAVAVDLDATTASALRETVHDRLQDHLEVTRAGFRWLEMDRLEAGHRGDPTGCG
ncbi:MAG: PH domain-containing protein [Halobacteriales archaeon]